MPKRKNPHAVVLGRLGGLARSDAKTAAARANVRKRWERVAERLVEQAASHPDMVK